MTDGRTGGIGDDMMWGGFQYLCVGSLWMCFSLIDGLAFDFYADLPSALLQPNAGPGPIFQLQHFLPHKQINKISIKLKS